VTAPGHIGGVEVAVIKTGTIPTPPGYVFRAEGSALARLRAGLRVGEGAVISPCLSFVVTHPTAGVVLIDTGFHPAARTQPRKEFGIPMAMLFRGPRTAPTPFDDQLRELDIDPGSVGTVIMTHLHVDHTSGMRLLANARFTISRPEWRSAQSRFSAARGYVRHHLPREHRVQLVDFERDGEPFASFFETVDFLGDGTIRLISTPGHTRGHMSVLLRARDDRSVLVAGDAAYTLRSIQEGILPMLTDDDETSLRSLRQLAAFMSENPDAIVVPTHDSDAWRQLPGATMPSPSKGD
jgi:glyoxylase-like metal-dependent hydrolase (beta-lactamase superfamily II)